MRPLKTHTLYAIVLILFLIVPLACTPAGEPAVKLAFAESRLATLRDPIADRSLAASPLSDELAEKAGSAHSSD